MEKGLLIVKAHFNTTSLDRKVMHDNICKQLENSNVVVLPIGWEVVYYPPGTEVVVNMDANDDNCETWKYDEEKQTMYCPKCGFEAMFLGKFCPDCGADLRGKR